MSNKTKVILLDTAGVIFIAAGMLVTFCTRIGCVSFAGMLLGILCLMLAHTVESKE